MGGDGELGMDDHQGRIGLAQVNAGPTACGDIFKLKAHGSSAAVRL